MQSLCWHAGKVCKLIFFLTLTSLVLRAHLFTSCTAPLDRQELLQLPKIHLVKINPLEEHTACSYMVMEFHLNWSREVTPFSALQCRRAESHYCWQHFLCVWLMFQVWGWVDSYTKENIQYGHISVFRENACFCTSLKFFKFFWYKSNIHQNNEIWLNAVNMCVNCIKRWGGIPWKKFKEQKCFITMDYVSTFRIWCHIEWETNHVDMDPLRQKIWTSLSLPRQHCLLCVK